MMNFRSAGMPPKLIEVTQAWLQRAYANAKAAKILANQDDHDLQVEAVTQVQQACEKATKAILLANDTPYSKVTGMGHNTIGAFVILIARMLARSPFAEDVSQALLKEDATKSVNELVRLVLSGSRNKEARKDVLYAFKQVLPPISGDLGNRAIEAAKWRRLTRAFNRRVIQRFVAFHKNFSEMWHEYINEIHNVYADPRPLIANEVDAETWIHSPVYAGLPRQESDGPTNPILADIAQQFLIDTIEQRFGSIDRRQVPKEINIRGLLLHISNWLTSLEWLFLCATVTTPHAVSSRYPAEYSQSDIVKGSQHYNKGLGVVACIDPLAFHTEKAIQNLIEHYSQIERGYCQMYR